MRRGKRRSLEEDGKSARILERFMTKRPYSEPDRNMFCNSVDFTYDMKKYGERFIQR